MKQQLSFLLTADEKIPGNGNVSFTQRQEVVLMENGSHVTMETWSLRNLNGVGIVLASSQAAQLLNALQTVRYIEIGAETEAICDLQTLRDAVTEKLGADVLAELEEAVPEAEITEVKG